MSERYIVEVDKEGCSKCGHDTYWTVVDTVQDSQISTSFNEKEHVEDICKWMNEAYEEGVEVGNQQGAGR